MHSHFLEAALRYHPPLQRPAPSYPLKAPTDGSLLDIPLGGGNFRRTGKYIPLLERKRMEPVEVLNERWRMGKGMRRSNRAKGEVDGEGNE